MMRGATLALALTATLAVAANAQGQTIGPGMSFQEVQNALGVPENQSSYGQYSFYFYENGCHVECGMADLVIFQNGQVVDAILRAPYRTYTGESSSPNGVAPRPTPMNLGVPQPQPNAVQVEVRPAGQRPVTPPPPPPAAADTAEADSASADSDSDNGG